MAIDKEKKVCSKCGGENVQELSNIWVDCNTGEYKGDGPDMDNTTWCDDCEEHCPIITEEEYNERNDD